MKNSNKLLELYIIMYSFMFYVYKITNNVNGKVYIGKTKNPKERWRKHRQSAKNSNQNRPIYNNIRKYGIDNFSFEILETFESEEASFTGECKWIDYYKSNDLTVGMNLTSGGEGPSGLKHSEETKEHLRKVCSKYKHSEEIKKLLSEKHTGKKLSDETKQKIRDAKLGKIYSEEHKEKLSIARKGKCGGDKNGFFGKKHSDETKKALSQSLSGSLSPRSKLKDDDVRSIREEYGSKKVTLKVLSLKYNISIQTIHQIVTRKSYLYV